MEIVLTAATRAELETAKRFRGGGWHQRDKRSQKVDVTCPDCKKPRTVTRYYAAQIRDGWHTECCSPCANRRRIEGGACGACSDKICRHCAKNKVNRPRGLCWTCYYTRGVKELYPSTSKYALRGVGNFAGTAKPCEPTTALPGTPEKVAILERRAAAGQELHHPLDASWSDETMPERSSASPLDPTDCEDAA